LRRFAIGGGRGCFRVERLYLLQVPRYLGSRVATG